MSIVDPDQTFFVGVGAQKSGTTWLGAQLSAHPDVWLPVDKELHYFDARHTGSAKMFRKRKYERLVRQLSKHDWPKLHRNPELLAEAKWLADQALVGDPDDDWYRNLFAHTSGTYQVVGEITPEYAGLPVEGFEHIASLAPQAKVIFLLRNPVDRLWSAARYFSKRPGKDVTQTLDDLMRFADRPKVAANGQYGPTIERLRHVFPAEQIHIDFFESMFESAQSSVDALATIWAFLGLADHNIDAKAAATKVNPSPAADLPADWSDALRERFAPTVAAVESLVGEVPSSWN